ARFASDRVAGLKPSCQCFPPETVSGQPDMAAAMVDIASSDQRTSRISGSCLPPDAVHRAPADLAGNADVVVGDGLGFAVVGDAPAGVAVRRCEGRGLQALRRAHSLRSGPDRRAIRAPPLSPGTSSAGDHVALGVTPGGRGGGAKRWPSATHYLKT